jgi:predicted short-subunit dehydrogenase-like oxidoreductase (DUF2520 family)
MKPVSVSFVGAGNLAWHLAPALDNAGYAVREVYSLHGKNARSLSEKLYQAEAATLLDFSESPSKIFMICVSDDAIHEVVRNITLPKDSILVHTSGTQPLSVLANGRTSKTGVLYPLQTFTRQRKPEFSEIPFFIESEDPETEKLLIGLAKSLSKKVSKINSDQRKALHLAAVFASNFTNHMLTLSKEVMVHHKLNFDHLKPLIAETINKSLEIGPENSQTGPAKRGDLKTLDEHMALLGYDETVASIYKLVTQHIIDSYSVE